MICDAASKVLPCVYDELMALSWDLRMLNFCLCDLFFSWPPHNLFLSLLPAQLASIPLTPLPLARCDSIGFPVGCRYCVHPSSFPSHFNCYCRHGLASVRKLCRQQENSHTRQGLYGFFGHWAPQTISFRLSVRVFSFFLRLLLISFCSMRTPARSLSLIFFRCFSRGYQTLFASYFWIIS